MNVVWAGYGEPMNAALGNWCAAHVFGNGEHFSDPYTTMGIFDGRELIAVVVFNNHYPAAGVVEMHGASTDKRWLTRPVLFEMFNHVFRRLGCQMAVMRVSERNTTWNGRGLHRFMTHYGFKAHRIPRLRGRDEDEIIYTLTDDDWTGNGFHKEHANG